MTVKELIAELERIANPDEEVAVFIKNSLNFCGNISEAVKVEKSSYSFFGESIPCVLLISASADQ